MELSIDIMAKQIEITEIAIELTATIIE